MSNTAETSVQQASPFREIIRSFGTSIPQISTAIAVIIGSLGLRKYFDAGAWTIIAILSFSLVYVFRRQMPKTVPSAALLIFPLLLSSVGFGLVLWRWGLVPHDPSGWSETLKSITSAYFALTFTLPLAVLVTSYQRQEEVLGLKFPRVIDQATNRQLLTIPFYKSKVELYTKFEKVDENGVELVNDMWYKVTNRTKDSQKWEMEYGFTDNDAKIEAADVDGKPYDHDELDRNFRYEQGVRIPITLSPKQSRKVHFRVRQRYRHEDGEIYSSYTPATDLKVTVENPFTELEFYLEGLYGTEPKKSKTANSKSMHLDKGVLPHQGVRVKWRRRSK